MLKILYTTAKNDSLPATEKKNIESGWGGGQSGGMELISTTTIKIWSSLIFFFHGGQQPRISARCF
jgi:hypothetical protein